MSDQNIHRSPKRRDKYRATKDTNLGTIQGFPQLNLLKRELGIKTIGELEEKTEEWLTSNRVDVTRLKNFLQDARDYRLQFAERGR